MRIAYVDISNFRGIAKGRIFFNGHSVLIGDNNAGKSTVFEAIDLVLSPDRTSRVPVIDEHDFYNGKYLADQTTIMIFT
jgi:putative ATP-dependent endonuclease of OLD family